MNLFNRIFSKNTDKSDPIEITSFEAHRRLEISPRPFLLDVRQPEEFQDAHIQGANLIPLGELSSRLGELPRDQEIIVVCHSGSRSTHATRHLRGAGYNAFNLTGGLVSWYRSGLPLKSSSHPTK